MRTFSRKKFESVASNSVKKCLPVSHLIALDGKEVDFSNGTYGNVEFVADGENWHLYPVYQEWCDG